MQLDEIHRTIDEMRDALSSDRDLDSRSGQMLLSRFNEAVVWTNQRLLECDMLLNKGLRSEAIQRCEVEPNLLEVVSALDFPELQVWSDHITEISGERPAVLLIELAAELNDAYSSYRPMHDLLRTNRLLALARAPLPSRITVMKRIAEVDRGNPFWLDDIRTFERARHEQLNKEIVAAAAVEDLNRIRELYRELLDTEWLETPPRVLIDQTKRLIQRLGVGQARKRMESLLPELNSAYANFDLEQGRQTLSDWKSCLTEANLGNDDELLELAAPALSWLEGHVRQELEEAKYREALSQLERLLDQGASRLELDRMQYAVLQFERGLPPFLEQRLKERFELLERVDQRRSTFRLLALLLAVLGICAVLAIVFKLSNQWPAASRSESW